MRLSSLDSSLLNAMNTQALVQEARDRIQGTPEEIPPSLSIVEILAALNGTDTEEKFFVLARKHNLTLGNHLQDVWRDDRKRRAFLAELSVSKLKFPNQGINIICALAMDEILKKVAKLKNVPWSSFPATALSRLLLNEDKHDFDPDTLRRFVDNWAGNNWTAPPGPIGSWHRPENWAENLDYFKSNMAEFGYFQKKTKAKTPSSSNLVMKAKSSYTAEDLFDIDEFVTLRGFFVALFFLCIVDPSFHYHSVNTLLSRAKSQVEEEFVIDTFQKFMADWKAANPGGQDAKNPMRFDLGKFWRDGGAEKVSVWLGKASMDLMFELVDDLGAFKTQVKDLVSEQFSGDEAHQKFSETLLAKLFESLESKERTFLTALLVASNTPHSEEGLKLRQKRYVSLLLTEFDIESQKLELITRYDTLIGVSTVFFEQVVKSMLKLGVQDLDGKKREYCDNFNCKVSAMDYKALKFCSQCKIRKYCSRECQAEDWPAHKPTCRKIGGLFGTGSSS